jgi:hypothetical protein
MTIEPTPAQLHALWNLPPNIATAVLDFLGDLMDSGIEPEDATVVLSSLERILFADWDVHVPVSAIANNTTR